MKKILCLFICLLMLLLCSCATDNLSSSSTPSLESVPTSNGTPTSATIPTTVPDATEVVPPATTMPAAPEEVLLSFDEIMRLPSSDGVVDYLDLEITLDEEIAWIIERQYPTAFVKGECLDVKYMLTWDADTKMLSGYTQYTVKITQIASAYNGIDIEINDTFMFTSSSYILPESTEDLRSFFLSHGAAVSESSANLVDLYVPSGDYELIPVQNVAYKKIYFRHSVPMCEGESFTFELCYIREGFFSCASIYPADADSLLIQNNYYDLEPLEFERRLAKEIFDLFD